MVAKKGVGNDYINEAKMIKIGGDSVRFDGLAIFKTRRSSQSDKTIIRDRER